MVRDVKLALSFIFGSLYASSWWILLNSPLNAKGNPAIAIPLLLITFGSIAIIRLTLNSLTNHWDEG